MSTTVRKEGGGDTRTPGPKRSRSILFIAGLIIFLIAISASGLLFFLKSQGKAANPKTNTVTPAPTSTPTAISTVTPPSQAVFYDTFVNNDFGWSLSNNAGYIRALENNRLTLTDTNPGTTLVESLPTNTLYDNYIVSADFTIVKADKSDSAGIYVRGDSNLDHDYRIEINGDNTFDIAKEYLDARNNPHSIILDGPHTRSNLNPLGHPNTVTVVMKGPQLTLYINNAEISSITDTDYSTGQIALFARASNASNGAIVSFSRVEVDRLPDLTPTT